MSVPREASDAIDFIVENIGGIDETRVSIPSGVTVLTGENATNRTSFLQAIMAALGSEQATLKGDAETGRVRATIDGETYERTLERAGDGVSFAGSGYLDDPEVADLFAFLLENNEARRSVARGDDLRELIMRPVDTDAIRREIDRLEREKATIDDELESIESRKRELPELEQRRQQLGEEIDTKREELAATEAEIDESNHDIDESRRERDRFEETLAELRETRSELESVRQEIDAQQASIDSLEREQRELESERDSLSDPPTDDRETLDDRIDQLRSRRQALDSEVSDLQSLIQYNEERLSADGFTVTESLRDDGETGSGAVTDQLTDGDEVVCWTCGSTVERDQIESTVDRLRELRQETVAELNETKSELESLKSDQREARRQQERREEIERKLRENEAELDKRGERLDSLRAQRDELTAEIAEIEAEVEELESAEFETVLDLHKEANEIEFEIDELESELEEVNTTITEIESRLDEAEELRAKRDDVVDELTERRTEIDRIEAGAVEEFNEHMDAVLDILDYENLDRIWIERVEETVREGRETVERTTFELHIVRTTRDGAAYEDTVEHLSESEREVTGLVFALAGYLVHDLHETVPFMLLDSLEAIDSRRIARLVDYVGEYADYLVVALLPEDAQAIDDSATRVQSI